MRGSGRRGLGGFGLDRPEAGGRRPLLHLIGYLGGRLPSGHSNPLRRVGVSSDRADARIRRVGGRGLPAFSHGTLHPGLMAICSGYDSRSTACWDPRRGRGSRRRRAGSTPARGRRPRSGGYRIATARGAPCQPSRSRLHAPTLSRRAKACSDPSGSEPRRGLPRGVANHLDEPRRGEHHRKGRGVARVGGGLIAPAGLAAQRRDPAEQECHQVSEMDRVVGSDIVPESVDIDAV
jgi:hypothetical protein